MKTKFYAFLMMGAALFATSCSDDKDDPVIDPVYQTDTDGVFIVNEGSYYSNVNGSLSYLDYATNTLTDGLFASVNGRTLGGTPNNAIIWGSKMYIACTDENRVEVVDVNTLKSISSIEVTQPRELVGLGPNVYVSTYGGYVCGIDTVQPTAIAGQSEVIGSCLEGIAAYNGYLYVCNAYNSDYTYNTNVVKLTAGLQKVKDIEVVCNPTYIVAGYDGLYLLSSGNYYDVSPTIQSIDANDKVTSLCNGTFMAYNNGKIYYIETAYDENWNTIATYYVYNTESGAKEEFTKGTEVFSPCAIAVDPVNDYVYISSYNKGAYGTADYSGAGYVVKYNSNGGYLDKYDAGVGPSTFVFKTSEKQVN